MNEHQKYERLFFDIAVYHRQNVRKTLLGNDFHEKRYQQYKTEWQLEQQFYEQFASEVEHHIYPSPFEQLFLETFSYIIRDYQEAGRCLDNWWFAERPNNEERVVLGSVFVQGMEHSSREVAWLFQHTVANSAMDVNQWQTLFSFYERNLSLRPCEKQLLQSFLWRSKPLYNLVHQYRQIERSTNDLIFIGQWQQAFSRHTALTTFQNSLDQRDDEEE